MPAERAERAERAAMIGLRRRARALSAARRSMRRLVTSGGFHGAYLRSSQSISSTAISGEGTGMERDYDYTAAPHGADLLAPATVGRSAGERAVARANPRKVETCQVPVVFLYRFMGQALGHRVIVKGRVDRRAVVNCVAEFHHCQCGFGRVDTADG